MTGAITAPMMSHHMLLQSAPIATIRHIIELGTKCASRAA
jgi:hypothetical protein